MDRAEIATDQPGELCPGIIGIHSGKDVKTPIMLLHGEQDMRCPTEQSEQFFTALRRQHKEAVFVRYPGEYHLFTKPSHHIDRLERILAWFEYYLA